MNILQHLKNKTRLKDLGLALILLGISTVYAQASVCKGFQGCTGIGTTTTSSVGLFLQVASTSPFLTYTFASSSGSGTVGPSTSTYVAYFNTSSTITGRPLFIFDGTSVAIGTSTTSTQSLTLSGGLFGRDAWGTGNALPNPIYDSGDRAILFWNPTTGGFGAFERDTGTLAPSDIGGSSALFGYNNKASGYASLVTGNLNTVSGNYSFSSGQSNTVSGSVSGAFGSNNSVSGVGSFAAGHLAVASSSNNAAFAMGVEPHAEGNGATVVGGDANNVTSNYGTIIGGFTNTITNANDKYTVIIGGNTNNINGNSLYSSIVGGDNSIIQTSSRSLALGSFIKNQTADNTYTFGGGFNAANPLLNNVTGSIMLGVNSNLPTVFIQQANGTGTIGSVGIGTTQPSSTLHVVGTSTFIGNIGINTLSPQLYDSSSRFTMEDADGNDSDMLIRTASNGFGVLNFYSSHGTLASPTTSTDGFSLGEIVGKGFLNGTYVKGADILFKIDGTPVSGQAKVPTDIIFDTNGTSTLYESIFQSDGSFLFPNAILNFNNANKNGLGTLQPSSTLHIYATSSTLEIGASSTTGYGCIKMHAASGTIGKAVWISFDSNAAMTATTTQPSWCQ